jgi:SAM-dependent methyltransferase
MAKRSGLAREAAEARYEAERRQGEEIATGHEDAWGWTSPAGRIRAATRAGFLIKAARLGPGVRCLELGAGTGEFTTRIASSGCDLTALEISRTTAAICRQRVGADATVVVGNAETGEGLDGKPFDAVVGVSVLHHLNLEMALATMFSLLKPGGRFAFSEPNMSNPQIWAERHIATVKRARHVTEHETAFRTAELTQTLTRHGYLVEVAEPFEFLHPATPPRLIEPLRRLERGLERTPLRRIAGSVRVAGTRR